jgi:hypothetical protein
MKPRTAGSTVADPAIRKPTNEARYYADKRLTGLGSAQWPERTSADGLYIEGARSYIAVETRAGAELLELELKETTRGYEQTARLDPGEYRLLIWQRPSAGVSDRSYDPPTDRCSAPFTVSPRTPILAKIELRAGERVQD